MESLHPVPPQRYTLYPLTSPQSMVLRRLKVLPAGPTSAVDLVLSVEAASVSNGFALGGSST